ncbi:MAG: tripartite tricarboxylate transporter TctB family protein [Mesorhizobium sp.]|uniref:tripartite tricarboxylate transporter TctB family protein n=1 Tax=Mesorhizobium sp. TaxID=1871066 RepID=UPI0011F8C324|nr:tripartite tricarboxylate transporter TctB family protein [Mesorhizobium sp.]TIQ18320.1 MAG: tripartite tricarboxylate transporter TctB family protein [Mesorhizobium sp.]
MSSRVNAKEIASGAVLLILAAVGFWINLGYPLGTASRMGPGYMPQIAFLTLGILGTGVLVSGFRGAPGRLENWAWRELVLILAAFAIFGALLEDIGMAVAIIALVVISGLADRTQTLKGLAGLAVVLLVICWLVFAWGLQIRVPFFPPFLNNL